MFFFSNVSSGYANVQHVVVGGVLTTSRVHVWRVVFCLPHNGTDRMVCSHATALQHTEQPVGDFICVSAPCVSSQLPERRCPRKVRTRVKFAVVRDCARPSASPSQATDVELVRVAMPYTQRNSVSEIGLHGEPLSSALFFVFSINMFRGCSPHVSANQSPRNCTARGEASRDVV